MKLMKYAWLGILLAVIILTPLRLYAQDAIPLEIDEETEYSLPSGINRQAVFAFEATAAGLLNIKISSDSRRNLPIMDVVSDEAGIVASNANDMQQPAIALQAELPAPGLYYIRASTSTNQGGNFTITLEGDFPEPVQLADLTLGGFVFGTLDSSLEKTYILQADPNEPSLLLGIGDYYERPLRFSLFQGRQASPPAQGFVTEWGTIWGVGSTFSAADLQIPQTDSPPGGAVSIPAGDGVYTVQVQGAESATFMLGLVPMRQVQAIMDELLPTTTVASTSQEGNILTVGQAYSGEILASDQFYSFFFDSRATDDSILLVADPGNAASYAVVDRNIDSNFIIKYLADTDLGFLVIPSVGTPRYRVDVFLNANAAPVGPFRVGLVDQTDFIRALLAANLLTERELPTFWLNDERGITLVQASATPTAAPSATIPMTAPSTVTPAPTVLEDGFTVTGLPNLVITLSQEDISLDGNMIQVGVRIANQGEADIAQTFEVQLELVGIASYDTRPASVFSLSRGGTIGIPLFATIAPEALDGLTEITGRVIVDPKNVIQEGGEVDNTANTVEFTLDLTQ